MNAEREPIVGLARKGSLSGRLSRHGEVRSAAPQEGFPCRVGGRPATRNRRASVAGTQRETGAAGEDRRCRQVTQLLAQLGWAGDDQRYDPDWWHGYGLRPRWSGHAERPDRLDAAIPQLRHPRRWSRQNSFGGDQVREGSARPQLGVVAAPGSCALRPSPWAARSRAAMRTERSRRGFPRSTAGVSSGRPGGSAPYSAHWGRPGTVMRGESVDRSIAVRRKIWTEGVQG